MQVRSLDHLVLTVADVQRTARFYAEVLGMTVEEFRPEDGTVRTALKFVEQKINLHQAGQEFEPKAKKPGPGTADLCFISEDPIGAWHDHLGTMSVKVELGPVKRTGATGPLTSIYIRDPDGNLIEISNRD